MRVHEIQAESVLVRTKLPGADYVINPYVGCGFGCHYCYASFMGRFVKEPISNWGKYIYVKTNAVELFRQELTNLMKRHPGPRLLLSSVTDPYQGVEAKYLLTRGILQTLAERSYPGPVSILTKSPLVLRDVDLLSRLANVEIGLTVTTTNDCLSRFLEVRAPLASRRLKALEQLSALGFRTYAFLGPLLPHFRHQEEQIDTLLGRIATAGVESVFVEQINLKRYIRERLLPALKGEPPEVRAIYETASTESHRQALEALVMRLLDKHGLKLRLGTVIVHDQLPEQAGRAKASQSRHSAPPGRGSYSRRPR